MVVDLRALNDNPSGYVIAYPDGTTRPSVSTLDYTANTTVTKEATVALTAAGKMDLYDAGGTTDMVVAVVGYYAAGAGAQYFPLTPARVADSRTGSGYQLAGHTLGAGTTANITVPGQYGDGVPANATAVVLNVTDTNATNASTFTLWPAGATKPNFGQLDFNAGATVNNETTVALGTAGQISIYNAVGSADVIVDVEGYFAPGTTTAASSYSYDGAARLTQAALPATTYNYGYGATTTCPANSAGANTNRTSLVVTGTGAGTTNYCYDNADRLVSDTTLPSGSVTYDTHGNTTAQGNQTFDYDAADQLTRSETPTNVTVYQRDPLDRVAARTTTTPITAVATTSATTVLGTTVSVPRPAGTQPGDVIVASIIAAAQAALTVPAGWTMAATQSNGGNQTWVAWYAATGSDPGSWTFTLSTSTTIIGALSSYHNAASSAPIDVTATAADASSTSQALPQVTTSGDAETVVHVVGYNGDVTPAAPAGDTERTGLSSVLASLLVADRYQSRPGLSAAVSATSNLAAASEAITVALKATSTVSRLGYMSQTDTSGFSQNPAGKVIGLTIGLPGGATYDVGPTGAAVWSYANLHGDTITTVDNNGNRTWTGYWGPYGEQASPAGPPANNIIPGLGYGYNGNQQKLTDTNTGIILMGARPYQPALGRFTQVDPVVGGCANLYTYSYGDPVNYPDLSGKMLVVPPGGDDSGDPGAAVPGLGCPGVVTGPSNFLGYAGLFPGARDLLHGNVSGFLSNVWSNVVGKGAGLSLDWFAAPIGLHSFITASKTAAGMASKALGVASLAATLVQVVCGTS